MNGVALLSGMVLLDNDLLAGKKAVKDSIKRILYFTGLAAYFAYRLHVHIVHLY